MLSPDSAFDLLTVKQVAQLLHCSKAHICNAVAGRVRGCQPIPAVRIGRRTLIRRETLLAWIAQSEHANDNLESSPERGRKSA
jgi:excisionase family DNA binding protein